MARPWCNLTPDNDYETRSNQRQQAPPPPPPPPPPPTETTAENEQDDGAGGHHQQAPTLPQVGAAQPTVVVAPPPHVANPPPQAQPHPPANQPAQAQPAQVQVQWMYGQVGPTTYAYQVPPPPIAYVPGSFQPAPGLGPYIVLDAHDQPHHSLWPCWTQGQLVVVPRSLTTLTMTSGSSYPIYPFRVQIPSGTISQDLAQPSTNNHDEAPVASGSGSGSVSDHDHVPADVAAAAPLSGPSTRDDSPTPPVIAAATHEAGPSDDVSDLQQVNRVEEMVHDEEDVAPVASDSGYDSVSEPESVHPAVTPAGLVTASSPHGDHAALAFDDIYEVMPSVEQQDAQCEDEFNQLFDWDKYARDTAGPAQARPARELLLPAAPETTAVIDPTVVQALPAAPAVEVNAQTATVEAAVQPTTRFRVRRREDDDDDEEEAGERETQAKRVKLTLAGPVDSENAQEDDKPAHRAVSQALDEASNTAEAYDVPSQPALDKNTSGDSEKKIDAKAEATVVAKDTEKDTTEKAAQVENVVSSDVVAPEAEPKAEEKETKNEDTAKTDVEKKSSDTSTDTPSDKSLDQPASEPAHGEITLPEPKLATAVVKSSDKENDTHDVVDPDASKSDTDLDKEEKKTPRKAAKKSNSVRREGTMPLSPRKQTTPRK